MASNFSINDPFNIENDLTVTGSADILDNLNVSGDLNLNSQNLNISSSDTVVSLNSTNNSVFRFQHNDETKFQIFSNRSLTDTYLGVKDNLTNYLTMNATTFGLGASVSSSFLGPVGNFDNVTMYRDLTLTDYGNVLKVTNGTAVLNELNVTTNVDIDGTLDVAQAITLNSTLALTGEADFNSSLDVAGTAQLNVLDVTGNADITGLLTVSGNLDISANDNVYLNLKRTGTGQHDWKIGAINGGSLIFNGGADGAPYEYMRINLNGNLGIGTTNPTEKLHVDGNIKSTGNMIIDNTILNNFTGNFSISTAQSDAFTIGWNSGVTINTDYLKIKNTVCNQNSNSVPSCFYIGGTYNHSASHQLKTALIAEPVGSSGRNKLMFCQNNVQDFSSATIADAVMTISNDGNVGIGVTNPTSKLDVNGNIYSTGTIITDYDIDFRKTIGTRYKFHSRAGSNNGDFFTFTYDDANGNWLWSKGFTLRRNTGYFGINKNNPSYQLDVAGDINFTGSLYQNGSLFKSGAFTDETTYAHYTGGRVKIGTSDNSSTIEPLHLHSTGNTQIHFTNTDTGLTNSDGTIIGFAGDESFMFLHRENTEMKFYTNNTQRLTILNTGTVRLDTSDGDKIQLTAQGVNGSKISHSSGWSFDNYAGPGNTGTYGLYRWFITESSTYSEKMRLTTTGRLGIGTTNPSYTLQVEGAAQINGNELNVQSTNSTNDTFVRYQINGVTRSWATGIDNSDSDKFKITTEVSNTVSPSSGTKCLTLDTSGNVGIGTEVPTNKLHVYGGHMMVESASSVNIDIKTSTARTKIYSHNDSKTYFQTLGDLYIRANGINQTTNSSMYINASNSYVGIGTDTPLQPLDIYSASGSRIRFETASSQTGIVLKGTNNSIISQHQSILDNATATNQQQMRYNLLDGVTGLYWDYMTTTRTGNYSGYTKFGQFDGDNDTHHLYINGNVGIGTSNPSYKLDVIGNIRANGTGNVQFASVTSGSGQASVELINSNKHFRLINQPNGRFDIYDQNNNGYRFCITTDGKIGFNNTSPDSALHIGSSTNGDLINLHTERGWKLRSNGSGSSTKLELTNYSGAGKDFFISENSSGNVVMRMFPSSTGSSQKVTMCESGGNVGINITPGAQFHLGLQSNVIRFGNTSTARSFLTFQGVSTTANTWINRYKIESISGSNSAAHRWYDDLGQEEMTLDNVGNLGLGTNSPQDKLHVYLGQIRIQGTTTNNRYNWLRTDNGNFYMGNSYLNKDVFQIAGSSIALLYTQHNSGGVPCMQFLKGYNSSTNNELLRFHRGSTSLTSQGTQEGSIELNSSGNLAFTNTSDERLKENIINYENGYNKVKQLRTVEFEWKDKQKKEEVGRIVGFIAQEAKEIIPKSVSKSYEKIPEEGEELDEEDFIYRMSHTELIPFNWSATRKLIEKVELLEEENVELKNKEIDITQKVEILEQENLQLKNHFKRVQILEQENLELKNDFKILKEENTELKNKENYISEKVEILEEENEKLKNKLEFIISHLNLNLDSI